MGTEMRGTEEEQRDILNLPQFNGHFKKYTDTYTMKKKGVSNEEGGF